MKIRRAIIVLVFFNIFINPNSFAGSFDGSRPLNGSVEKIIEINKSTVNIDVSPDTIGLPQRFIIDLNDNVVRPSIDSIIRKTIKIKHVEHVENKLVLQGIDDGLDNIDDGLAWSIVISKKTGKSILTASGDGLAFVVFGICTVENNNQ